DPPIPRQFPLHIPVNCNGIASAEFFLSGGSFLALPFVLDFFGFMSSDIPHHKYILLRSRRRTNPPQLRQRCPRSIHPLGQLVPSIDPWARALLLL
ncbi:unnamed protein product, partial [Urochloa humidicola]